MISLASLCYFAVWNCSPAFFDITSPPCTICCVLLANFILSFYLRNIQCVRYFDRHKRVISISLLINRDRLFLIHFAVFPHPVNSLLVVKHKWHKFEKKKYASSEIHFDSVQLTGKSFYRNYSLQFASPFFTNFMPRIIACIDCNWHKSDGSPSRAPMSLISRGRDSQVRSFKERKITSSFPFMSGQLYWHDLPWLIEKHNGKWTRSAARNMLGP